MDISYLNMHPMCSLSNKSQCQNIYLSVTVFALAVMEYAVDVSKFGKNPMTLLVHQY